MREGDCPGLDWSPYADRVSGTGRRLNRNVFQSLLQWIGRRRRFCTPRPLYLWGTIVITIVLSVYGEPGLTKTRDQNAAYMCLEAPFNAATGTSGNYVIPFYPSISKKIVVSPRDGGRIINFQGNPAGLYGGAEANDGRYRLLYVVKPDLIIENKSASVSNYCESALVDKVYGWRRPFVFYAEPESIDKLASSADFGFHFKHWMHRNVCSLGSSEGLFSYLGAFSGRIGGHNTGVGLPLAVFPLLPRFLPQFFCGLPQCESKGSYRQPSQGSKEAVVLIQKPEGASSLSVDKEPDDTAIILGVFGGIGGGLLAYAGLKRLCEVAFAKPKYSERDNDRSRK
jgi:hypothetical protein